MSPEQAKAMMACVHTALTYFWEMWESPGAILFFHAESHAINSPLLTREFPFAFFEPKACCSMAYRTLGHPGVVVGVLCY